MPIIYANPAFTAITGYPHNEVIGRDCRFLQGEGTDQQPIATIRHGLNCQIEVNVELPNYRRDGSPFWNHLLITPMFDDADTCNHLIVIQQDITRQKEQQDDLADRNCDVLQGYLFGRPMPLAELKKLHWRSL